MKILVPIDGSELSLNAVRYALRLIHQGLHANFVLATVLEPSGMSELLMMPDPQEREAVNQSVGAQTLDAAATLLEAAGVHFEREVRTGYAATEIVDVAECFGCDAIMIGARGLGTLRSALLGSVSQAVLHAATMPVTIVPHTSSQTGALDLAGEPAVT